MKLNEFLKNLKEEIPEYEIPEYDEGALVDALKANKPDIAIKAVFGEAFYPKIIRWMDRRLRNIDAPSDVGNLEGGPLRYKLDQYLDKEETSEDEYDSNAETLAREILGSIEEWGKKVVKDAELPKPIG